MLEAVRVVYALVELLVLQPLLLDTGGLAVVDGIRSLFRQGLAKSVQSLDAVFLRVCRIGHVITLSSYDAHGLSIPSHRPRWIPLFRQMSRSVFPSPFADAVA